MKLDNHFASSVVDSSGVQSTSTFNIARTPHMFNILSSGLYSDKIAAVLREIACNAMDAHIMFGTPDRPIEVKLPTALDREFYVKDWGPGLDDHEVRTLYTTYGWSSKQQNDDVTGAFGLGSKSPFAYTLQSDESKDGFSVESVKDGIKRIYTCYIDDSGGPAISRLYEGPCEPDWTHGVKVTFPVQQKDIAEFEQKARKVFRWFKVMPEVLGLSGVLERPEFTMSGSFFGLQPKNDSNEPAVVMGGVRYPLRAERFNELSRLEKSLLGSGIHLMLPMGDVMMTPSREELEYVEKTRSAVQRRLKEAVTEVAQRLKADVFADIPQKWVWLRQVQEYVQSLPIGLQSSLQEMLTLAEVDKNDIDLVLRTVNERTVKAPRWMGRADLPMRVLAYKREKSGRGDVRVRRQEVLNGRVAGRDAYVDLEFSSLADPVVVHADSSLWHERVRSELLYGDYDCAIVVVPKTKADIPAAKAYAEQIAGKDGFDGLPVKASSEFEVPAQVRAARQNRKAQPKLTPAQKLARTEVFVLDMLANSQVSQLGELVPEETYYAVTFDPQSVGRRPLKNETPGGQMLYTHSYGLSDALGAMRTLSIAMGHKMEKVIVVKTEKQAKRLQLVEQGFKPLLTTFNQRIGDAACIAKAQVHSLRYPVVNLSEMHYADSYGLLGILGHHKVKNTAFWGKISESLKGHPLLGMVEQFAHRTNAANAPATGQALLSAVSMIRHRIHGLSLGNLSKFDTLSSYDILHQDLYSVYPMAEALSGSTLKNWMHSDMDKALNGILLAVMLSNTVDVPQTVEATAEAANEPQAQVLCSQDEDDLGEDTVSRAYA